MNGIRRAAARIFRDARHKRYLYAAALLLLLIGFFAGCRYRSVLPDAACEELNAYISRTLFLLRQGEYSGGGGFFYTLLPYIPMYLILAATCLHPAFAPLATAVYIAKGFYLGFFTAASLGCGGFGTAVLLLLSVLPTKLIAAAFLIAAGAEAAAAVKAHMRRCRYSRARGAGASAGLFATAKCFGITAAVILLETLLSVRILTV